jgi:hypothetical protein
LSATYLNSELALCATIAAYSHRHHFYALMLVINFFNQKRKTCTTISHVPQKATITETGKASLSDQCSEPL